MEATPLQFEEKSQKISHTKPWLTETHEIYKPNCMSACPVNNIWPNIEFANLQTLTVLQNKGNSMPGTLGYFLLSENKSFLFYEK